MTTKVVKGSLWTLAGQIAPMAVTLIATPFTIRLLGSEGYGVFVLVALIPTYLGFADFGMGLGSTVALIDVQNEPYCNISKSQIEKDLRVPCQ